MPSSVLKWTLRSLTSRSAMGGSVPHSRVEERVDHVDDQVQQDDEERAEQDGALDRRQIALLDRVEGQAADAGDVEDRLGEDGAAEQDAEVQAEDRDDRRDRRAHAVLEDDASLPEALRAGGAYVVLVEHIDEVRSHEARIDGRECGG